MTSSAVARHSTWTQSYDDRAELPGTCPLAAYLFRLMALKRTNLCISADVSTTHELLQLAEEVGDYICLFKTHADIIDDFGQRTTQGLLRIARRKGFLIFEDRKFGDIGSTVQKQYTSGPLQIVRWANIVNCHIFPGPAIITALSSAAEGAVAAYSSTVETNISGPKSEQESYDQEGGPADDSTPATVNGTSSNNPVIDHSMFNPSYTDGSSEMDPASPSETKPFPTLSGGPAGRLERKQSVVSVTTSISTKTENISNAQHHHPSHHNHKRDLSSSRNDHELSNANGTSSTSPADEATETLSAALEQLGSAPLSRSLLLLAQMSSANNLMDKAYSDQCALHARNNRDFVMGFIAQTNLNLEPQDNFITMTPGINLDVKGDGLGQTYNSPEDVVGGRGCDVAIVGRGIVGAQDRVEACMAYRSRAWKAYEERVGIAGRE